MTSRKEMDRVCGMWIDKESAPFQSTFNEETYYFCSQSCKEHFDHDQEFYLKGFEGRKPFRRIVADSRDIVLRTPHPRYLAPFYFVRRIFLDIALYASPGVKAVAALVVVVPVLGILALGVALYRHHQAAAVSERRMAELISQIETGRLTQEEMERRIERERETAEQLRRRQEELVATLTETLT